MQLLVPSLVVLLVGVAIAYFILPSIAPAILIGGGVVALLATFYVHRAAFGRMEYEQATWQYNLRKYASYVMIGGILLGAYGFYAMNQSGGSVATAALPAMGVPAIGGGMGSVVKNAMSRIHELVRRGRISLD
jgi:hypothetical protein